jgi:hypothetical protein
MKLFARLCFVLVIATGTLIAQDSQPKTRISGYMFGDFYYNVARDSSYQKGSAPSNAALSGVKDLQGFQFRRIYLTMDNDIASNFTSRFRLEADQSALTSGASGGADTVGGKAQKPEALYDGKISVFIKDAYLKWKNVFEGSDMIFGIQPTTAYDISEAAWGYRSLDKTIMDLRGIIPSRDFGVALRGKLTSDGMFNYWAMIANGDGNKPATTQFHRYSLNLQVKPVDNLQVTVNGDYRAEASINDPTSTLKPQVTLSNDIFTGSVFVGYAEKNKYSFGVEGFQQSTFNGIPDSANKASNGKYALKTKNAMGFTVYASVYLQDNLALVGRYDYFDPTIDGYFKGDSRNYVDFGFDWKVDKNVSIIPNLQYETYESLPHGMSIDPSVNARVTFYYIFL